MTRELVERLEAVEAETVVRLAGALAAGGAVPVPQARAFGAGALVATGAQRYVNRAVGVTLEELSSAQVLELCEWFSRHGLPPAVQLSPWAPSATVEALVAAGFNPASSRSVLALDLTGDTTSQAPADEAIEVSVVVSDQDAAGTAAVMAAGEGDRAVALEFMAADRRAHGTTQLLARTAGRVVGCASVTVVGSTAWLGAAATVVDARGRGVQAELLRRRLVLARDAGCDLVGATASVGSTSARNLQRVGFGLVQDQWVMRGRNPAR